MIRRFKPLFSFKKRPVEISVGITAFDISNGNSYCCLKKTTINNQELLLLIIFKLKLLNQIKSNHEFYLLIICLYYYLVVTLKILYFLDYVSKTSNPATEM